MINGIRLGSRWSRAPPLADCWKPRRKLATLSLIDVGAPTALTLPQKPTAYARRAPSGAGSGERFRAVLRLRTGSARSNLPAVSLIARTRGRRRRRHGAISPRPACTMVGMGPARSRPPPRKKRRAVGDSSDQRGEPA